MKVQIWICTYFFSRETIFGRFPLPITNMAVYRKPLLSDSRDTNKSCSRLYTLIDSLFNLLEVHMYFRLHTVRQEVSVTTL